MSRSELSKCLFGRDSHGDIKFWRIEETVSGFKVITGALHSNDVIGNIKRFSTPVHGNKLRSVGKQILFEIDARIKSKKNKGYYYIEDLNGKYSDNELIDTIKITIYPTFYSFMRDNLPTEKVDLNGILKPMLARPFSRKRENSFPKFIQPKINGIRCFIRWGTYTEGDGMFAKTIDGPIITSREGNRYRVPRLESIFNDKQMFIIDDDQDLIYDGELYIHGESVNYIKSSVPMVNDNGTLSKPSGNPDLVQFWCFDIAILAPQNERFNILNEKLRNYPSTTGFSESVIIRVPTRVCDSVYDFIMATASWIEHGFEGGICRIMDALYQFGVRGRTMEKLKEYKETECVVVDIIPKSREPETALFLLRNDINNETFECNPMGTYSERKEYLDNKDTYIGKKATVKFYERSGVKKCPWHGNVVTIRDYE
jgi:hypothetical protein